MTGTILEPIQCSVCGKVQQENNIILYGLMLELHDKITILCENCTGILFDVLVDMTKDRVLNGTKEGEA